MLIWRVVAGYEKLVFASFVSLIKVLIVSLSWTSLEKLDQLVTAALNRGNDNPRAQPHASVESHQGSSQDYLLRNAYM